MFGWKKVRETIHLLSVDDVAIYDFNRYLAYLAFYYGIPCWAMNIGKHEVKMYELELQIREEDDMERSRR